MRLAYKKRGVIKFCACYNSPTEIFMIIAHDLAQNRLFQAYYGKLKTRFLCNFIDLKYNNWKARHLRY
jgi:hypothetical protein